MPPELTSSMDGIESLNLWSAGCCLASTSSDLADSTPSMTDDFDCQSSLSQWRPCCQTSSFIANASKAEISVTSSLSDSPRLDQFPVASFCDPRRPLDINGQYAATSRYPATLLADWSAANSVVLPEATSSILGMKSDFWRVMGSSQSDSFRSLIRFVVLSITMGHG